MKILNLFDVFFGEIWDPNYLTQSFVTCFKGIEIYLFTKNCEYGYCVFKKVIYTVKCNEIFNLMLML